AHGHQGAVAERDLPGVAGQQVEAHDRDEEAARTRELGCTRVAEPVRQDEHEREGGCRDEHAQTDAQWPVHTRLTDARPSSPDGRTSRTARMTARAAGWRRSVPTQDT